MDRNLLGSRSTTTRSHSSLQRSLVSPRTTVTSKGGCWVSVLNFNEVVSVSGSFNWHDRRWNKNVKWRSNYVAKTLGDANSSCNRHLGTPSAGTGEGDRVKFANFALPRRLGPLNIAQFDHGAFLAPIQLPVNRSVIQGQLYFLASRP